MLTATIFKHPRYAGCSNGGISELHDEVTIVNASGPDKEPTDKAPAVILEARKAYGGRPPILTFYPASLVGGRWIKTPNKWWMSGGSFINTSDSRLTELCDELGVSFYGAISFHDRCEG